MCGVIAMQSQDFVDLNLFKKILIESMVRGKHSTGVSWLENDEIKTITRPLSADKFDMPNIKTKSIIGHCRYSTSSVKFNQPIADDSISVAHNGVITQINPKKWGEIYDCDFTTECDSEIILRMLKKGIHPLQLDGSMSVVVLNKLNVSFFRNEERPLYYSEDNENVCVASSKNILERCNLKNIKKAQSCMEYTIHSNKITSKLIRKSKIDLQY
tara:strand:- start:2294 stop:2935 length:642 start_codon:yes stop_codon:yes gene_type:complete